MLIFDITTYDTAIRFLTKFTNLSKYKVLKYIKNNSNDYNASCFIEELNVQLEELSLEDIDVAILHVTTNGDNNQSIKKYGLLNLQQSLTMNTPLKKFLKERNIIFDIYNHTMLIKDKTVDITYSNEYLSHNSLEERINNISYKIYKDYQINGFFCSPNPLAYGGGVSRRPEILSNINQLFKNAPFETDWKEQSKSYIIKFRVPLDELIYFSFYDSNAAYMEDIFDKQEIKHELINKALKVIWNYYYMNQLPEIYAYLKPEVFVPYRNILSIT